MTDKEKKGKEVQEDLKSYRLVITHKNVKELEDVTNTMIHLTDVKNKEAENDVITLRGPIRMPTKVLRITTRKSPCGNGKNFS